MVSHISDKHVMLCRRFVQNDQQMPSLYCLGGCLLLLEKKFSAFRFNITEIILTGTLTCKLSARLSDSLYDVTKLWDVL